ncbi:MAG: shikimate dehydrogenase [Saprospiraceae bacterium]|nr:shikimate dehydrogenase [Saprospiraceae bacterium]
MEFYVSYKEYIKIDQRFSALKFFPLPSICRHFVSSPMAHFGLLGTSLQHSFSKAYFEKKWREENVIEHDYELVELPNDRSLRQFLNTNEKFKGLNITIPFKVSILDSLSALTTAAKEIKAVNCILRSDAGWVGHNTDAEAFSLSMEGFVPSNFKAKALILGSGGASRAVQYALKQIDIEYELASQSGNGISYDDLHLQWDPAWKLIVNTTPLGMYPDVQSCPKIPYQLLDESFYLMDLVYNPEKTLFLALGAKRACQTKNGLEMLHIQADLSWEFWNQ